MRPGRLRTRPGLAHHEPLRRSSDAPITLPDPPTSGAGPAPAGRHLDRILSHLRLAADHAPAPRPAANAGPPAGCARSATRTAPHDRLAASSSPTSRTASPAAPGWSTPSTPSPWPPAPAQQPGPTPRPGPALGSAPATAPKAGPRRLLRAVPPTSTGSAPSSPGHQRQPGTAAGEPGPAHPGRDRRPHHRRAADGVLRGHGRPPPAPVAGPSPSCGRWAPRPWPWPWRSRCWRPSAWGIGPCCGCRGCCWSPRSPCPPCSRSPSPHPSLVGYLTAGATPVWLLGSFAVLSLLYRADASADPGDGRRRGQRRRRQPALSSRTQR